MPWPRDDAKLDRVRALMAEQDLDALVVRAPDNVLYLTNFWGMKGYDAVVFPREGDPVLICLEASQADAERMSWTPELRLFDGYHPSDPRPPGLRALDLARQIASEYDRVGLELSLGTQAADRMVGEPTTYPEGVVRRISGGARRDAAARAGARDQDGAGDRADAARERDRRRRDGARPGADPAGDAGERGRRDVERLGARPRDGLRGEGRPRARLLARLVGAGDPHLHRDRQPSDRRARADALRDLGLRRRLLVRPHQEPRPGRARPALRGARAAVDGCVHLHHFVPFGR